MADTRPITPNMPAAMAVDAACGLIRGIIDVNFGSLLSIEQTLEMLRASTEADIDSDHIKPSMLFGVLDLALNEMKRARDEVENKAEAAVRALDQDPYRAPAEAVQ